MTPHQTHGTHTGAGYAHTDAHTARRRPAGAGRPGHPALPHRVRHRRGPRHGHRHRAGLDNAATVALAIVLAFVFGYALTMASLRAGLPVRRREARPGRRHGVDHRHGMVDNAVMLAFPVPSTPGLAPRCSGARWPSPSRWPSSSPRRSTGGSSAGARATPSSTRTH